MSRIRDRWDSCTTEQHVALVLLFASSLCAFFLSAYQLQSAVNRPFRVSSAQIAEAKKIYGESPEQIIEREKRTDTDGDSLSDWDEVNTYKLSPNLRDTCGDGMVDNVRVVLGKNMDCGTQARTATSIDLSQVASNSSTLANPLSGLMAPTTEAAPSPLMDPSTLTDQFQAGRNPEFIRQLLKDKVSPEKLKAIPDEELLRLYDMAIDSAEPTEIPQ